MGDLPSGTFLGHACGQYDHIDMPKDVSGDLIMDDDAGNLLFD